MTIKERVSMLAPVILALPFCEIIDIVVQFLPRKRSLPPRTLKRLLIVRLDAIGDFIIFLDSFKEYRKLYPATQWEITLLGNKLWASLANRLNYADRFDFIETKKFILNPLYRFRILNGIRRSQFDCVIEPTYSRSYLAGDSVVRASGAQERIGNNGDLSNIMSWQKRRSDRWYTRLIPGKSSLENELERNADFLRGLGLDTFCAAPPSYPSAALDNRDLPQEAVHAKHYFVLFPGASFRGKQWPAKHFSKIARKLYLKTGWSPLVCGGPNDVTVAEQVVANAPELPWNVLAGRTSLPQMMNLLSQAHMLIANDTGIVHMASAVKCPVVCIMGGGQFGRFFPYGGSTNRIVSKPLACFGCNWWCRYPTVRCISDISADDAWKEIDSLADEVAQ